MIALAHIDHLQFHVVAVQQKILLLVVISADHLQTSIGKNLLEQVLHYFQEDKISVVRDSLLLGCQFLEWGL